jgi:hypothetical protein|eukprot:g10964.t1 g10964   contig46:103391-104169(-)
MPMKKVLLALLLIIVEVASVSANTLRGSEESKRELYGGTNRSGGYGYRHPYRFIGRRGGCKPDLYLVEDDSERSTKKCTDNLRDEFWREVNSVKTVHTAIGARYGDLIYYVNQATNCGDVWIEIDEDIRLHRGRIRCYRHSYGYDGSSKSSSSSQDNDNDSTSSEDNDNDSTSSEDNDNDSTSSEDNDD